MTCHYLPTVLPCGFIPSDDVLLQFYAPENFFSYFFTGGGAGSFG